MINTLARHARTVVIVGFALLVLSALLTLERLLVATNQYPSVPASTVIESLLSVVATIMALGAWWWLTQLAAIDETQVRVRRRGLLMLSLQYLAIASINVMMIVAFGSRVTSSAVAQWLCEALGALTISVGFLSMAQSRVEVLERAVSTNVITK